MVVAFRRYILLPLDDCLYALQPLIPHLTRPPLHRCVQRHGIFRLPDIEGDKPKRQRFKRYPIGFFHIDIAEVQIAEGKLYLFASIDRTRKFAVTRYGRCPTTFLSAVALDVTVISGCNRQVLTVMVVKTKLWRQVLAGHLEVSGTVVLTSRLPGYDDRRLTAPSAHATWAISASVGRRMRKSKAESDALEPSPIAITICL
jgi:hypothetical protein